MLEQLIDELRPIWNWILAQLGWQGVELSWVHILVIALAIIGALIILRNLLGGHSGGGSSHVVYPPAERQRGLPTRYYTGSERLSDFSVSPEVYDFKVPSPTPDLSRLRELVSLDLDKARELFVPAGRQRSDSLKSNNEGEVPEQNLPAGPQEGGERRVAADSSGTPQPATLFFKPNWELARKLFIPNLRRRDE